MKKRKNKVNNSVFKIIIGGLLFVIVINFLFPKEVVLECTTSLDKDFANIESETMNVDLYYKRVFWFIRKADDSFEKSVTATFKRELTDEEVFHYSKNLRFKYCNRKLKDHYSCESSVKEDDTIVVHEKGSYSDIIENTQKMSQKKYKKYLKKNGYSCKRKKTRSNS